MSAAPPVVEAADPAQLVPALQRLGLASGAALPAFTPLTGGVASDIWLVRAGDRAFVVKRALARLRVAADWRAPTGRNAAEVEWLRTAARIAPGSAPEILGHDPAAGFFAMEYLAPDRYPLWKSELAAGRADPRFAARVGDTVARIHAATAGDSDVARQFANDATIHAIRLEPYLEATALRHPDLGERLHELSRKTLQTKRALVHGDVSPKNILMGPAGPVFLDAECAWYGDPAFDLAFCLNHMLLKVLWTPRAKDAFLACFDALAESYLAGVTWEAREELERRAAALLPGLFLARVDGKSPVEYVNDERLREHVRAVARPFIGSPAGRLAGIRAAWAERTRILS